MAFYFYNGAVPGCVRLKDINTYAGCSIEADVRASDVLARHKYECLAPTPPSQKGQESQAFRFLLSFYRLIGLRVALFQISQMLRSSWFSWTWRRSQKRPAPSITNIFKIYFLHIPSNAME